MPTNRPNRLTDERVREAYYRAVKLQTAAQERGCYFTHLPIRREDTVPKQGRFRHRAKRQHVIYEDLS